MLKKKLEQDMKRICDLIDAVQEEHGGIYITASHINGNNHLLATCTVDIDGDYKSVRKYKDSSGKYFKCEE